jgi:hypothetical protein
MDQFFWGQKQKRNVDFIPRSSSAFALHIEHFAYYCGFYFAPFRPSNSDFGYTEEGESTAGYTFTPLCGIFC